MKKILVHSNYPVLNKNSNMLRGVGHVSVKDFLKQMYQLKISASTRGIELISSEISDLHGIDAFIFVDCPDYFDPLLQAAIKSGKPIFLLVWESDLINKNNHNRDMHKIFSAIFTYDDSLVDSTKYFKVAYSFDFSQFNCPSGDLFARKLVCMVAGNNYLNRPGENYSLRRSIINWYAENFPDNFDLYGIGWGKIVPPDNLWHKIYNKLEMIHPIFSKFNKCYKGETDNKIKTASEYKFQICLENSSGQTGYVSEKLFDAFFSCTVPVYLGAPNIEKLIPSSCYIDYRNFSDFPSLHSFLSNMNYLEYQSYLESVLEFFNSDSSKLFKTDFFCDTIINVLVGKLCI
ncbi:glycosyltransferase family 10 domain-containing protein [Zooshikella harenae]|uniref:Fucosyltransferase C-terminal domain-containing protein n=1 Tax=Zooshikella harenae TaxID=2827238 RepID=A0ABS5Z8J6_9GAMM|nr:glycosyltransferase family 10 [Zooshikella harenae]MBU2710378.1 hypothetical protein [Zooshikella harenae]